MSFAILFAAAVATAGGAVEHRARIDHAGGAVEARYNGAVEITHKQLGAAGPGGRGSTLRCAWRADLLVTRDARHPSGSSFARAVTRPGALQGSRPGWCAAQRGAIAREVARRGDALQDHVVAVAEEDRALLSAELDLAHGARVG